MSESEFPMETVCGNCTYPYGQHRVTDNACPVSQGRGGLVRGFSDTETFVEKD